MSDEEVSKLIKKYSGMQSRVREQPEGIVRPGETK